MRQTELVSFCWTHVAEWWKELAGQEIKFVDSSRTDNDLIEHESHVENFFRNNLRVDSDFRTEFINRLKIDEPLPENFTDLTQFHFRTKKKGKEEGNIPDILIPLTRHLLVIEIKHRPYEKDVDVYKREPSDYGKKLKDVFPDLVKVPVLVWSYRSPNDSTLSEKIRKEIRQFDEVHSILK